MSRFFLFLFERAWLSHALVAVVSVSAALGLARLRFDDDYLNLIRSDAGAFSALERAHSDFESEVNDLSIVIDAAEIVNLETLEALREFVRLLDENDHVDSVVSIFDAILPFRVGAIAQPQIPESLDASTNFTALRSSLTDNPMVVGQLLDRSATTTLVVASLVPRADGSLPIHTLDARLDEVRSLVEQADLRRYARVRFTGPPAIRSTTVKSLAADQFFFAATALVLAVAVGLFLFRSWGVVIGVAAPPLVGVIWTFGFMGLAGEPINLINGTIAPLLLAITITDTVHLVSEMRGRRLKGSNKRAATVETIAKLAGPCTLTSVTTAIGFGSLMAADIELVQRFGATCAIGVMCCFAAVMILTPRWASTRWSDPLVDRAIVVSEPRPPQWLSRLWQYPRPTLAISLAVFATMLIVSSRLETDVRATTELPAGTEAFEAFHHMEEAFGGMLSAHVVIRWPPSERVTSPVLWELLAEVHDAVTDSIDGASPFSVLNIQAAASGDGTNPLGRALLLGITPKRILRRLVEPRNRSALVYARVPDLGARALLPVFDRLNERLRSVESRYPGYTLEPTGLLPVHVRTIDRLVATLARSLFVAIPVIFLTLMVAFRSARLAAASLVPNGLPLAAIATYLVVTGGHVGIAGALSFTVALGIAVDDTIHFIDRYRLARRAKPGFEAATEAWSSLAGVMLVTTAILTAGFGSLAFSDFTGLRYFSGLSCLALAVAVVGDLVVLPAWLVCAESEKD